MRSWTEEVRVDVAPEVGEVSLPELEAVWSKGEASSPENSATVTAALRGLVEPKVMVMVLPEERALVTLEVMMRTLLPEALF